MEKKSKLVLLLASYVFFKTAQIAIQAYLIKNSAENPVISVLSETNSILVSINICMILINIINYYKNHNMLYGELMYSIFIVIGFFVFISIMFLYEKVHLKQKIPTKSNSTITRMAIVNNNYNNNYNNYYLTKFIVLMFSSFFIQFLLLFTTFGIIEVKMYSSDVDSHASANDDATVNYAANEDVNDSDMDSDYGESDFRGDDPPPAYKDVVSQRIEEVIPLPLLTPPPPYRDVIQNVILDLKEFSSEEDMQTSNHYDNLTQSSRL